MSVRKTRSALDPVQIIRGKAYRELITAELSLDAKIYLDACRS